MFILKINWKVRFKNPIFIAQIILAALTPLLAYVGLSFADLTTWRTLWDLVVQAYSNPYLLALIIISVFNTVTDPTVKGLGDSKLALRYDRPRDDSKFVE
ncbi:phage holin [Heyndrickxia sporothermodurans]|uniref:phage holin n=1 Tax=Heyndrickxia sporothermodurans TaxID=46224 RepID=UPI00082708E0|nr:phage holin [Heyndrickxia sporothermodurans]